jgi:hypothetical protein
MKTASFLTILLLGLAGASLESNAQSSSWSTVTRDPVARYAAVTCRARLERPTRSVAVAANGDVVVTGCSDNGNHDDFLTVRYSGATGELLWSASFAGGYGEDEGAAAVTLDAAGDVIVTGRSAEFGGQRSIRTIKYRGTTGETLWTSLDPAASGFGVAIATNPRGDVFITGVAASNPDIRTIKLDRDTGETLWSAQYNGAWCTCSNDRGEAIVVDAAGDVYVTGSSGEPGVATEMRTFKYDGETGEKIWDMQFGGPGSAQDESWAAVLDGAGGLVIAGYSTPAGVWVDYRIIKLDATTGATIWSKALPGATLNTNALARAVAVDAAGDVFVTGEVSDLSSRNWRTVKLSGSTGDVLWTAIEDSVSGEDADDIPNAIIVDAGGNPVITGSWGTMTRAGRVIKYRGSDGAQLWATDIEPETAADVARGAALAADAAGDIALVTSTFRVLKISGSNGGALWSVASPPPIPGYAALGMISAPRDGRIASVQSGRVRLTDAADGHVAWFATSELSVGEVAIDAAGNVFVAGAASDNLLGLAKYRAEDGSLAWQTVTAPDAQSASLVLDAAGNPIAMASHCTSSCVYQMTKRSGIDGAVIWTFALSASGGSMALDAEGDVFIAGSYQLSPGVTRARITKVNGSTGLLAWEKNLDWDNFETLGGLGVDASGDVLAISFNRGLRRVKLRGSDGSVSWDRSLETTTPDMFGAMMTLAPGGDLVMARMAGDPQRVELTRFSSEDGSVLWARRFGDGVSYNIANAVTFDSNGNVVIAGNRSNGVTFVPMVARLHGASGFILGDVLLGDFSQRGEVVAVKAGTSGEVYVAGSLSAPGLPRGALLARIEGGPSAPPTFPVADLNGNGTSDVLWRHTDGRVAAWLMDGLATVGSNELIAAGTGWSVSRIADLDGDGKADLVWSHDDGRLAVYLMDGLAPAATAQLLNAGSGWHVSQTADLDGDGRSDLVFEGDDGTVAAWLMNGTSVASGATIMAAGSGWHVTRVADFDADGKDDLLWTHEDGRVAIWLMDGLAVKATNQILNAASGWTALHAADVDGDMKADIVWGHTDGRIAIWLMDGAVMASGGEVMGPGTGWTVARTGDFDFDLKTDLVWQHPDGRVAVWLMNGLVPKQTTQLLNAGSGWNVASLEDLDGDGKADIVWQNVDGSVALWLMDGTTMTSGSGILGPGTGWSVSGAGGS